MDLGQLLAEARPWVSTGGILTTSGIAIRLWFANRKLRLVENADDRAGYGDVIRTLREELKRISDEMILVRADHRNCEDRLSRIEGELMGFHRQALIQSQAGLATLPASSMVQEAGVRSVAAAAQAALDKESKA